MSRKSRRFGPCLISFTGELQSGNLKVSDEHRQDGFNGEILCQLHYEVKINASSCLTQNTL